MAEQVRPSESDRTELTPEAGLSHQRSLAQQRSRDRLERILAAASRLIAEKGSDHVKMSEVAASAEISIGSLYQYFPDKRAIIRTLAERYAAASRQCIEQALADVRDLKELRDAFASLVDQYYAIFLAEPVMRDIWSGTQADKALRDISLADSRINGAVLAAAIVVVALAALIASGGSGGHQTLDERVHEIGAGLRCPVCLNLSVADSPSTLAGEMRTEIETQVRAGRSPDQIRAFFIDRYGEWILLSPPRHGWNLLPWAVPIVGMLAGVGVWVAFVRRRVPRTAGEVTETEHRRIEHQLADLEEPG